MTNSIEVLVVFAIVALAICVALSAEKNTSLPRASGTASAEAASAEASKAAEASATEPAAATATAAAEDCRAEEHTSATHGTAVLAAIVFVAKDCSCYDNANDYQEDQHKDAVEVVVLIKLLL